MIIWIFTLFLFPLHSASDSQYECGPHGRFEYCIDGIPGCVIGCHCHPGYFFDTDTKICEPNTKLTQDFRRHYLLDPTRIQDSPFTRIQDSPFIYPTAANDASTTTNPIDDKVDEITKDADDIGDWLYNQFFKTIENQVINKTKGDEPLTRRSGSGPNKKPKKRSRKNRKRNKKKRKKGLKSKLLRITHDDSLFDSSSGSTSDEDSSSSSSSGSSGESDSSFETYKDNTKNDKDHGHKKIVIFNKKPKPPLPSFIFLPNIETPFYPPIGLPPPPAVPMYPMVPVPPVGPMFPYQGVAPKCEDDETTTVTTTILTTTDVNGLTTTSSATASITTTDFTTTVLTTSDSTSTSVSGNTAQPNLRSNKAKYGNKFKARKPKHRKEEQSDNEQEAMLWNNFNQDPENNFMQKLRQKMKAMKNKPFIDQFQEAESPLLDLDISTDTFSNSNMLQFNPEDKTTPKHGNVNFKYLSQLIHRVDGNKTNSPSLSLNQNRRININQVPQRRMNNFYDSNLIPGYGQPSKINMEERIPKRNEPNDSYYSNLGRQIATMIRNIDSNGERQVNIEIEQENPQTPSNPLFFENSYAPRSYWERSVRSPLRYYNSKTNKLGNFRKSDENLLSIENQVEIAATTAHSLSLKELENIIRTLGEAQSHIPEKNIYNNNLKSFKTNRFSLLPKNEQARNVNDNYNTGNTNDLAVYLTTIKPDNFNNRRLETGNLMNFHSLTPWKGLNKKERHADMFYNMNPTRRPNTIDVIPKDSLLKKLYIAPPRIPKIMQIPFVKVATQKPESKYQLKPMQLNYRGLNYYSNNDNNYLVGKATYPVVYPNEFKHLKQFEQPSKQSYFQHVVHHFDYFDEMI